MKSYLKFLSRNKLYTAIEAVGLIVSLAFVIIIGSSIRDQLGIVYGVPDHEHLYLVGPHYNPNAAEYRMREKLVQLPQLEKVAAFTMSQGMFGAGDEKFLARILVADSELLEMIPLRVRSGDSRLLKDIETVVITESFARRHFPDRDPVGEFLPYYTDLSSMTAEMRIAAVIEDPSYSLLGDFDVAVNILSEKCQAAGEVRGSNMQRTGIGMMVFFLAKILPESDLEALSEQIEGLKGWRSRNVDESMRIRNLTPCDDIYLSDVSLWVFRQGKKVYLSVLVALGLLLLLSALLSYINLSLASSGGRAKEMATRRLVGDDRTGIFRRVMGETLLFTLLCFLLAVLLAFLFAPLFDSLRPTGLNVPFRIRTDAGFWLLSSALVLLLGFVAGLFPALTSASFRPLDVVSGRIRRKRKMYFNRICVILQSTLALILLAMALTLGEQLRYMEKADIGTDPAPNLYYFGSAMMLMDGSQNSVFIDRLRTSPLVLDIGYTTGYPTFVQSFTSGKQIQLATIDCDLTAFEMLGFRVKEQFAQISGSVMVSERAANASVISERQADPALLYYNYGGRSDYLPAVIGGIIEDFRLLPVNGSNPVFDNAAPIVEVKPAGTVPGWGSGLLIHTTGDRDAFVRWFRSEANAFTKESIGMNLFSIDEMRNGYIDDLIASDFEDLRRYTRLVEVFSLVAILLSLLALLAMSSYYAGTNAKGIAIRKVFGGTITGETRRGVLTYMIWIAISIVIAIPVSVWLSARFLQDYAEHITNYWWIFVIAALLTLLLSFASVLWQTLRAARTDPAAELKKE